MYATVDFYKNDYKGKTVPESKLEELLTRASDDMDVASLGRIFLQELSDEQKDWLARATCAQAEDYAQNGTAELSGSVSLGSFSGSADGKQKQAGVSLRALKFLVLAGLANRAVRSK